MRKQAVGGSAERQRVLAMSSTVVRPPVSPADTSASRGCPARIASGTPMTCRPRCHSRPPASSQRRQVGDQHTSQRGTLVEMKVARPTGGKCKRESPLQSRVLRRLRSASLDDTATAPHCSAPIDTIQEMLQILGSSQLGFVRYVAQETVRANCPAIRSSFLETNPT